MKSSGNTSRYNHGTLVVVGLMALAAAIILGSCYTNPATGRSSLNLIPQSQEISMGREANQQIIGSIGVYAEGGWEEYVSGIGLAMASKTTRPDLPWEFHIMDDPNVNAFALPGGYIYVTRGMLYHVNNEAELAGVIGHEIGHVTARHSVNQISKQQLLQLGWLAGTMVKPELEKYSGLVGGGLGLLFLKFSRDDERESDDLGLRYMYSQGYDPREMDDVFEVLQRLGETSGGGRMPVWLSTHPAPEDRVARIRSQVTTLQGDFDAMAVREDAYLDRLNGLIYGPDPREGYFIGDMFYHPEMAFMFGFPQGWSKMNQKQGVVATPTDQDAIIQITLASGATPDAAAAAFFEQQGITAGASNRVPVNGFPAVTTEFTVADQETSLSGVVTFLSYNQRIFQALGYTTTNKWSQYRFTFQTSVGSFNRLSDPEKINVEPRRLQIVRTDSPMTIEQFDAKYPSHISLDQLAIINQVQRGQTIPAGTKLKRVSGKPVGE